MAIQCSGNVVSGANAAYTPQELAHQLADSGTGIVGTRVSRGPALEADTLSPSRFYAIPRCWTWLLPRLLCWGGQRESSGLGLFSRSLARKPGRLGTVRLVSVPARRLRIELTILNNLQYSNHSIKLPPRPSSPLIPSLRPPSARPLHILGTRRLHD